MCVVETFANEDGTFSAWCNCGWSDDGHATDESAARAAGAHQSAFDKRESEYLRGTVLGEPSANEG